MSETYQGCHNYAECPIKMHMMSEFSFYYMTVRKTLGAVIDIVK